jgi:transcriptional regulator with XRE-family HTH domain
MSRLSLEVSRLRKEVGITQKQLAKLVGVSESFIIDVESGRKILKDDMINRISKALRKEVGKLDLFDEDSSKYKSEPDKDIVKVVEAPVKDIWNDALSGVIMNVPVYNYSMEKIISTKCMPIISNKIEGYPKEKVFYLMIEDNNMTGFKISKSNHVFSIITSVYDKDGIYMLECSGKRILRQIKSIGSGKYILIKNDGNISTETVENKDIKIIAKLIRLEILL